MQAVLLVLVNLWREPHRFHNKQWIVKDKKWVNIWYRGKMLIFYPCLDWEAENYTMVTCQDLRSSKLDLQGLAVDNISGKRITIVTTMTMLSIYQSHIHYMTSCLIRTCILNHARQLRSTNKSMIKETTISNIQQHHPCNLFLLGTMKWVFC